MDHSTPASAGHAKPGSPGADSCCGDKAAAGGMVRDPVCGMIDQRAGPLDATTRRLVKCAQARLAMMVPIGDQAPSRLAAISA